MKTIFRALRKSEFWISLFVVFYLLIAFTWLTRKSNPILKNMAGALAPFAILTGLDQNWALFSPTLRDINLHNVAMITFRNGLVKIYEWPRMDRSDLSEQGRNEKYRKMFIDCIPWSNFADFYPSVARFVARSNLNPENPPVRVTLSYFWNSVPHNAFTAQSELPAQTKYHCYYIYEVQPRDLP